VSNDKTPSKHEALFFVGGAGGGVSDFQLSYKSLSHARSLSLALLEEGRKFSPKNVQDKLCCLAFFFPDSHKEEEETTS
jgi:hypothetical protein